MVLSIPDQEFARRTPDIIDKMDEYQRLTDEQWPPYNYTLGYENAEAWYSALTKAIEEAKKEKTVNRKPPRETKAVLLCPKHLAISHVDQSTSGVLFSCPHGSGR